MSVLLTKIEADFRTALKAHEKDKARVLRLVINEIRYATKEKRGALNDGEIQDILSQMVKKRYETIAIYRDAGRDDKIAEEEFEIAIIEDYLPKALGRDEIIPVVKDAISATGAVSPRDLGRVMGVAMKSFKAAGCRVDGALVRKIVTELLSD